MFRTFILLSCIGNEWPNQGLEPQPPITPPPFGLWAKEWLVPAAPGCGPGLLLDADTKKFQRNWRTFLFVCLGFRLTLWSCNVLFGKYFLKLFDISRGDFDVLQEMVYNSLKRKELYQNKSLYPEILDAWRMPIPTGPMTDELLRSAMPVDEVQCCWHHSTVLRDLMFQMDIHLVTEAPATD